MCFIWVFRRLLAAEPPVPVPQSAPLPQLVTLPQPPMMRHMVPQMVPQMQPQLVPQMQPHVEDHRWFCTSWTSAQCLLVCSFVCFGAI